MTEPVVIVCGFGRCGSSLVMQMLNAGGMPTTGRFPAFEDDRASPRYERDNDASWLHDCAGRAVKLLDPQRFAIPRGDYRAIWCSRDLEEQGRSQAKFGRMMLRLPIKKGTAKALSRSYVEDKPRAIDALLKAGIASILDIRFEKTLARPWDVASDLAALCQKSLNIDAMAAAVRPRSPLCAPGLDMELSLVEEAEAAIVRAARTRR